MTDETRGDESTPHEDLDLPPNLSMLVGALVGPEDLGRNHDKYLSYPDRDSIGGAASA